MKRENMFSRPAPGWRYSSWIAAWLFFLALVGCSAKGKSVRDLPPEEKQFLSEVRYVITRKEIKLFKNTPPAERPQFIEQFWKMRDPDPTTEENEFRDEYYRRIEKANHLFHEGSAGWLSDRGRILILLGEPERRDVFPTGYTFYGAPVEIWYYGAFPVVFIDSQRVGVYKLEPISVRNLGMINSAQMQLKPKGIERKVTSFDFKLTMQKSDPGRGKLFMEIPYRLIYLIQKEKSKTLETRIKVEILIRNAAGENVVEKEEKHPVAVSLDALERLGKNFTIEFPISLPAGKYSARVTVENTADKNSSQKEIDFNL